MGKFKFYDVDKEYVDYLRKVDSKIPNISYATNDKFVCGVLFSIHNMNYFAPISSFSKQQRTNILIKNSSGKVTSSIRLSFMFPVPDKYLSVKDFSKENPFYKRLLLEELDFCNRNAERIISKALYIYQVVAEKNDEMMCKNCCDFLMLEKQYLLCEAMEQEVGNREPDSLQSRIHNAEQKLLDSHVSKKEIIKNPQNLEQ